MRMLIAAAALATLVGSPAFAQSYMSSIGSGNIAPPIGVTPGATVLEQRVAVRERRPAARPHNTFASRPSRQLYLYSGERAYGGDRVRGTDPDPNLQFQLNRESQQGQW